MSKDGDYRALIYTPPEANGVLRLQDGIHVAIIDDNHCCEAIRELQNELNMVYYSTLEPFPAFSTIRENGRALFAM